ncbi:hypothetical protein [Rothia nasimurium]|uniref:hypothetical protein n=1 Tax=Rothia nasimurium TaxID=85336 RepID=UPI00235167A3|nr:hypothetical protein [Rothia nasimurium]
MKKLSTLFLLTPLALSLGSFSPAVSADAGTVKVESSTLTFASSTATFDLNQESVNYTVKDINGTVVTQGTATGTHVILEGFEDGYYTIEFNGQSGVPFIVASKGSALSQDNFYGIGSKFELLNSYSQPGTFESRVNAHLDDLQALGFDNMRASIGWNQFEQQRGVYGNTAFQNQWFDAMKARHFNMFSLSSPTNTGAYGTYRNLDTPELKEAYANYIVAYLDHNPSIKEVEVYNEFNHPHFNTGDRSGTHYAELMKVVYPKVKAKHPDVTLIAGATSRVDRPFFEDFLKNGGADYFDAWSFHPYNSTATTLPGHVDWAQWIQTQYGIANPKPIYVSEFGWSLTTDTTGNIARVTTVEDLASNLVEAYTSLRVENQKGKVPGAFWYTSISTNTTTDVASGTEDGFGVYQHIPSISDTALVPNESAYAFYNLRTQLEGYIFDSLIRDGELRAYKFLNAEGTAKFVVFTQDSSEVSTDALGFEHWKSVDALGRISEGSGTFMATGTAQFVTEVQVIEEETTPVTPENPVEPETPVTPEPAPAPETPVTPENPVEPETPVTPEPAPAPETPVTPENPVEPETPVTPEPAPAPETPVVEQEKPKTPAPVVPETGLEGATVEARNAAVVASEQAAPAGFSAGKVVAAALGALAAWGFVIFRNRKAKDA